MFRNNLPRLVVLLACHLSLGPISACAPSTCRDCFSIDVRPLPDGEFEALDELTEYLATPEPSGGVEFRVLYTGEEATTAQMGVRWVVGPDEVELGPDDVMIEPPDGLDAPTLPTTFMVDMEPDDEFWFRVLLESPLEQWRVGVRWVGEVGCRLNSTANLPPNVCPNTSSTVRLSLDPQSGIY